MPLSLVVVVLAAVSIYAAARLATVSVASYSLATAGGGAGGLSMPMGGEWAGPVERVRAFLATVFTTVGKAWLVDKIDETVQTGGDYVGWGTGAGTAAVGDTTLFTEASEARVSATRSQPSADTIRWVATITADGTKTITNAGNLTASSGGTLIVKGDFTGVALLAGDSIAFTIDLQIT